jgi:FKBP-type peptidyl-prolyl cis-trans isomerase FkpA
MKVNTKLLAVIFPVVIMGMACTNMGYKKTKTGLEYKIFEQGKGRLLKNGDIIKFNYRITYNDSVIAQSYGVLPGYDMVDSVTRQHDFAEVLKFCKIGDSLVTIQFVDTLSKANPMGMPPYMKKGGKIKTMIKIFQVFTSQDSVMIDYQAEMQKFKDRELLVVESYLQRNNVKAQKLNGVYVEVTEKGSGAPAASGKLVSIKYSGSTFDGKYFDSNVDSTKQTQKHGLEPFSFVAGTSGAISGMLEGITAFNQGGKGRIFIPSSMGYGPQGSPPVIKPNEHLIFEVEVLEVKDQAADSGAGMTPQMR